MRKTHDAFVAEIASALPNVLIIGKYAGNDHTIRCKCNNCGYEWNGHPRSMRHGAGCPSCRRSRPRVADPIVEKARRHNLAKNHRKSHEQFLLDAAKANPKLTITGQYISSKTKISCQCKQCGYSWNMIPSNILKGRGCPECSKQQTSCFERYILFSLQKQFGEANVLSRDKSAISKELDVYIPNLDIALEPGRWFWHKRKFEKDKEKYELCKQHGIKLITIYDEFDEDRDELRLNEDFITYPYKLGGRDKKDELVLCVKEIFKRLEIPYTFSNDEEDALFVMAKMSTSRKSTDDVIAELVQIHNNIELLSDYQDVKTKMRCRCAVCGKEFESNYEHLIRRKQGCPDCYRAKNRVVNLDTGEIFESIKAAGAHFGVTGSAIGNACHRRTSVCRNYHWAFLKDLTSDQLTDLRAKFPDTFKY
jgi:predicted Zn-ribbon and HTH transcriptional regulator